MDERTHGITALLVEAGRGDDQARDRLMENVYAELRDLAAAYGRSQRAGHTLQPTALVHEAFLKLVDANGLAWNDRAHFFAIAAQAMRQILTDHARARRAEKRGGRCDRVTLDEGLLSHEPDNLDLLALDDALRELGELDPRRHQIVEMRFFGGLTVEEVARHLRLSTATIESDWRSARAWLAVKLGT